MEASGSPGQVKINSKSQDRPLASTKKDHKVATVFIIVVKNTYSIFFQIARHACAALNLTQVRTEYTRPGYGSRYGFTNWPMKKDYYKRECVRDHYVTRMRLNAIRKNRILPKELRVSTEVKIMSLENPREDHASLHSHYSLGNG